MSNQEAGVITEQGIQDLRDRIGKPIHRAQPHIETATKDAIRHFAHGIGDTNPLWTDAVYAAGTRHGSLLAPPCILFAMDKNVSGYIGGLPGVHGLFAGTNWTWHRPICVNDEIRGKAYLKDVVVKEKSNFAGKTVIQYYQVDFVDQAQEKVAEAVYWGIRTERKTAKERGSYKEFEQKKYTPQDVNAIRAQYEGEKPLGAEIRYWEDVQVGETLPPRLKGPLTVTGMISFISGWGGLYVRAHKLAMEQATRHPSLGIPNAFGFPEPPEVVHWDPDFARSIGAPTAYDYGPERVSWLGHLMTDWIGDDGFLRSLNVQVNRINALGDMTWCKGKVTRKHVVNGQHVVECEVWAENQDGAVTAKGDASVQLLSKRR